MVYRLMGLVCANALRTIHGERMRRLRREERGQGTVEYVALILLVAVLLAGVVAASRGVSDDGGIAKAIVDKIRSAISGLR